MFKFVMLRMPSSDSMVSQLKTHLLNTKGNLKIKEEFSVCKEMCITKQQISFSLCREPYCKCKVNIKMQRNIWRNSL